MTLKQELKGNVAKLNVAGHLVATKLGDSVIDGMTINQVKFNLERTRYIILQHL